MLNPIVTFRSALDLMVTPADDILILRRSTARQLDAVGVGNHIWLVIRGPWRAEVVKYTHTVNYDAKDAPDIIAVERSDGCRLSFGCGDCIEFIWTAEAILEWITQNAEDDDE